MARKPKRTKEERDDRRDRAAVLLYRGDLTQEEIARELGICRRTLGNWQRRPEVIALTAALHRIATDESNARFAARLAAEYPGAFLPKTTQIYTE